MLGAASEGDSVLSSILPTKSGLDTRLAVDRDGMRHLLVAVRPSDKRVPEEVNGALKVKRRPYTFNEATSFYLDVQCTRGDLFDVFDELLTDIMDTIDAGGSADAAIGVIQDWRSLLAVRGRQTLSLAAQRGLFAELTVLRLAQPDGSIDFSHWRGPLKEPHDILMPTLAIEVKSVGRDTRSVEMHGALQLSEPGRPLSLVLVELTEEPSGQSLTDLAEELIEQATDHEFAKRRLRMAGVESSHLDSNPAHFTVTGVRHLIVGHQTPRITPEEFADGALPEGLLYLVYGVEVAALDRWLIEGVAPLRDWIQELNEGR